MKVLEVEELTKVYKGGRGGIGRKRKPDFTAVDHISFSLEKGEIVGFLGPNGAGKTTTIQMMLGTLTPSSGKISYFGEAFEKNKEVLRRIGFASAYSDLPWRLSVWENLSFYSEIYEVKNKRKRVTQMLREFGAEKLLNKQMNSLSSGEKTRVLLVKAFLNQPEIVLLDEPTASLDVEIAVDVRKFIKKQQKEFGTTVLLTSHNMRDVEELADRVIVINRGKIVDEGTPLKLMQKMNRTRVKFDVFEKREEAERVLGEFGEVRGMWEGERVEVEIRDELIPKFLAKMFERKVFIRDLEVIRPGLEEYFIGQVNSRERDELVVEGQVGEGREREF